jgi:carbonic anhydrase/acetyltransferase-like protein (isoleucine patch superfamily)
LTVYALGSDEPRIDPGAWIHAQAVVIGNVTIGAQASIWPCAVLRGDYGRIEIGARTSIQDGTVVHTTPERPTVVGAECVVGHNAYVEGCTIEDEVLVGSLSAVLPGAVVGRGAVIAAGAVVTRGMSVPPLALARGVPARVELDAVEPGRWSAGVQRYVEMAARYRSELRAIDP